MFVDGDDYIPENACEILVKNIEEKQADFITANYINCDETGVLWEKPIFDLEKYNNFKVSIEDYKDSFYIMNSSVCNKIFDKSFIDKYNMRFEEGIFAEDAVFTMNAFIKSENVYYIKDIIYYYRQRNSNDSISNNCSIKYFRKINKAYKMIYDEFLESNHIGLYRCFYAKSMTYMLYKFIDSNLLNDEERIEILSEMRWFYKLSKTLNVPACQKSLSILTDKIQLGQYQSTIDICKVIADVRLFMTKEQKEQMSKPNKEMYSEILSLKY